MRDSPVLPPVRYAIDVECVATGPTHNDRAVAQVAVVDQHERVVLNIYVKPPTPVFAYLTALTGVTKEHVENEGISLAEAVERVRQVTPERARNRVQVARRFTETIEHGSVGSNPTKPIRTLYSMLTVR